MGAGILLTGFMSLLLHAPMASSQPPSPLPERPLFRNFAPADGLPSNTVHKLAQDRLGNLWIATLDGLARYDGVEFKVWRHDPDDPHSLPGNDVQHLVIDGEDRIWLAIQDGGIARYDAATDRFENWRHDPTDSNSLPTDRIWAIAEDGAGGLWLGGFRSGLSRLDASGHFRHYRHDPADSRSLCDDIVVSLMRMDDGTLWISTAKGLCRWQESTGFMPVTIPPLGNQPAPRFVINLGSDRADRLWLSTDVGLRVLTADGNAAPMSIPDVVTGLQGWVTTIEPDGELWFGSIDGLRRWNLRSGDTVIHRGHSGHPIALHTSAFLDILRDHEGSLWFASQGSGLAQLLPQWRAIRAFLPEPGVATSLPSGRVRMVTADHEGRLWIVANVDVGVSELDPVTGTARSWFADSDGSTQPDASLLVALRDREGRLWTGHRGRIARYTFGTGNYRFVERGRDGTALPATLVRRMAQHPDGPLFAAFGGGGMARVDAETMKTDFAPLGDTENLPCAEIADIRFDAAGGVWLACEQGLLHAPNAHAAFHSVRGAPPTAVDGLVLVTDDRLWLHTLGLLAEFRIDGDQLLPIRSIGASDGWPVVKAGGLLVDGDGIVWVTTSRGLYSYEPEQHRIVAYDENDGLPSAEFSPTPPAQMGPFLFAAGTMSGPVIIDTRRLRSRLPVANLRWHEASLTRGTAQVQLTFDSNAGFQLHHDDHDLRVSVRMNSFAQPDAHRYRFLLDGYDNDWTEQIGNPERVFERLPSGRHTLTVEAIGSDGQPAGNQLRQVIHVGLPPWQQPWAIALYAAALLALAYAAQRLYRRRLENRHALVLARERQQWAEQVSDAKSRFLASVGHEIRTPMAGLLGMNSLLLDSPLDDRQTHYARSVRHAGEHMLTLVNDLLDLSRIEAGKLTLEPSVVDLVALADELVADVAAAAERKTVMLSLCIEPGTPLTVRADGKRLRQILLNFLSNAIKFTPSGHVRLIVSLEGNQHCFAVEDEGPGLSSEMQRQLFQRYSQDALGRSSGGSGLGLSIAYELAQLMGGTVGAEDRNGGGSRFWLCAPLDRDAAAIIDTTNLPRISILDTDNIRANDLVTSLAAIGVEVRCASADGNDTADGTIVLAAAHTFEGALDLLERSGLNNRRRIVSLPLAADAPGPATGQRILPGPWQLRSIVETLRAMAQESSIAASGEVNVETTTASTRSDLNNLNLLIVEDDPILREVLSTRLSERGAHIAAVDNGLSALSELDATRYDAVLLDLDLPELDGLHVLRLMTLRMGLNAPPVIVVTARQHADDETQSRQAGARAFFRKPVDPETLAQCLLEILDCGRKIK